LLGAGAGARAGAGAEIIFCCELDPEPELLKNMASPQHNYFFNILIKVRLLQMLGTPDKIY